MRPIRLGLLGTSERGSARADMENFFQPSKQASHPSRPYTTPGLRRPRVTVARSFYSFHAASCLPSRGLLFLVCFIIHTVCRALFGDSLGEFPLSNWTPLRAPFLLVLCCSFFGVSSPNRPSSSYLTQQNSKTLSCPEKQNVSCNSGRCCDVAMANKQS